MKTTYDNRTEWRDDNMCLHRIDGPAVEYKNGAKVYYIHSHRHRDDGPAIINDAYEAYYINGELHKDDGPAKIWFNGNKEYYIHGFRHRIDGPAMDCSNGNGDDIYYINGAELTKKEFDMYNFVEAI